ncbi:MAG: hypothetical protein GTO45_21165 [Candidatus Aminicenantes bacterium]|nr:hypothetical protein [Candidatus Aminicenantes bacterium]NIM81273.1 hypothetical protein [Candidatus Aminicenantes bacterium]NIN20675.1 hypothetical protein [Candidatus Aminicenantes bacterium]NIN44451.1 hypothetical protein [Candidatus Aminicenantes bacterium]NIN87273.1 hypothetical protein [Candidatus Aminicenantes bacterium]
MKKKVLGKYLSLKKETIVHLSPRQMEIVKGGCTTITLETCDGCETLYDGRHKESDNTCYTEEP